MAIGLPAAVAFILAFVALEAVAICLVRYRRGQSDMLLADLMNLISGASLLTAVMSVASGGGDWIALFFISLAGVTHAFDMRARLKRRSQPSSA